jgi:hypothetical protein
MSNARVLFLHQQQTAIMSELNVTVLDVYEGTYLSAHEHIAGDALHYVTDFCIHMRNWFYADA